MRTERNMEVFSLWDTTNRRPTLDVLLTSPVPFADLLRDALTVTLDGVPVTVASVAHLIASLGVPAEVACPTSRLDDRNAGDCLRDRRAPVVSAAQRRLKVR